MAKTYLQVSYQGEVVDEFESNPATDLANVMNVMLRSGDFKLLDLQVSYVTHTNLITLATNALSVSNIGEL